MKVYRVLDSFGHEVAEVEASSADEALEKAAHEAALWAETERDPYVDVLETEDPETGVTTTRWVVVDQDEPDCRPRGDHVWDYPQTWGHGGSVAVKTRCPRCGITRVEDDWFQSPHGVIVPKTVTYYYR